MQLLCKVLCANHEGIQSHMEVKLTRSTLRKLCDLSELGQD